MFCGLTLQLAALVVNIHVRHGCNLSEFQQCWVVVGTEHLGVLRPPKQSAHVSPPPVKQWWARGM